MHELHGVRGFESLDQNILKLREIFADVGPRKLLVVKQVDDDVEGRLDVVPPRLVVPSARVQRREQNIAIELPQASLLDVLSRRLQVAGRQPEIDQVNSIGVLVTDEDVFKLYVVVDETHLVQRAQALSLFQNQTLSEPTDLPTKWPV